MKNQTAPRDRSADRANNKDHDRVSNAKRPKIFAKNRKATFDYEIDKKIEAGLVLEGWEARAIKSGRIDVSSAYVKVLNGELFLIGATIMALEADLKGAGRALDTTRTRKLLCHRSEIDKMVGHVTLDGMTIVPLSLYSAGRNVKIEIGVGKGRKNVDKRAVIKNREISREARVFQ